MTQETKPSRNASRPTWLRFSLRSAALFLFVLSFAVPCFSQRGSGAMTVMTPGSGRNILYGDLKVDESKAGADRPATYTVILYMAGGTLVGRETVSNGGRYRFNDLADGDYDLAIELDSREVTRSRVRLYSQPNVGKTDTRHDIELEFRAIGAAVSNKAATVSAEDMYHRSSANQSCSTRDKGPRTRKSTTRRSRSYANWWKATAKTFRRGVSWEQPTC